MNLYHWQLAETTAKYSCPCGRSFTQPAALKNHQNSCKSTKSHLSAALAKAKEAYAAEKSARESARLSKSSEFTCDPSNSDPLACSTSLNESNANQVNWSGSVDISTATAAPDHSLPVEERPAKRRRVLAARLRNPDLAMHDKKLRDILPQPLLPPPSADTRPLAETPPGMPEPPPTSAQPGEHRNIQILDTPCNTFGLFRRYHAPLFPSHDPEANATLSMLTNNIESVSTKNQAASDPSRDPYDPYPNKTSFLLGEWYWGQSSLKSMDSFQKLLGIIGCDTFSPADLRDTNWKKIDKTLAINEWDEEEWQDDDAGWQKLPVTIRVPFHRLSQTPGPREYTVLDFYHRSLVSVVRDKITNMKDNLHFHFDPYELYWQSPGAAEAVRLHGELYTSPAFNMAHQDLQRMPGEPRCDLPRVVVALMFWSDSTHLTTFGNAKLWPLYMFFGNESKYRRCAPNQHLCEHVAYFEEVMPFAS
jgi:hypothetical protein